MTGRMARSERDDLARLALNIRRTSKNQEDAKKTIAGLFRVSPTTAVRLLIRGRHLALQGEIEKATA